MIAETVGIPTFKGSKYAADLPTVLDSVGEVQLSTITPADDLLRDRFYQKALEELENVERNRESLLKKPGNISIKELPVGRDFPMRVMAEIVDAPLQDIKEVTRLAKHYVKLGADIIDIGMVAGEDRSKDAGSLVKAVRKTVNVPVSVDSLNPKEIHEAVKAGADLVLSGDAGNLKVIAPFIKDIPIVIIPTNQREGYFPASATDRVLFLEELLAQCKQLGISRVLADLVLEPSNVLESLLAFHQFAVKNPDVPLFVGVSNVTELIDADSVGVNALLARMCSEIGAGILLATEKSDKAKGTVLEEVLASKMMFLAKRRNSVPKDLGIDLLILKDKRKHEETYNEKVETSSNLIVAAEEETDHAVLDSQGMFRILVDRKAENIVALHFAMCENNQPDKIIKGKNAEIIYARIIETGLVTRLDHAAYLGSELSKAEISLRTGKEYIQDTKMFAK